ncbi:class II aldolase/adducin family protein [Streptomyces sp. NPDC057638]|uniref:class II aldolase/adducin family protein n=1 Tax=Streptomyces sp. NPDC057638 TaxID=3346190 RepID=UPI00367BC55F
MTELPLSADPAPLPVDRLRFAWPPGRPVPGSVAEERAHRRTRLAGTLRLLARLGYEEGVSGLVTARDPEFPDRFWANPFGLPFALVTPDDLVQVNGRGEVLAGRHHINQAAFAPHAEIHRARPDVVSVAHAHAVHGRALAAIGEPLLPLTQEACAFYEDHALVERYTGVAVDEGEARAVATALGPHKAAILRNHGTLTVGDSVDAAAWWLISLERCARIQLAASAAGAPLPIGHRDALATRERLGTDLVAWISYQPLWRELSGPAPAP